MGELSTQLQGRNSEKGFTLVELLVVIVIIGILAAVAVFAVGGITDKGQDSACDADRRSLQTAVEAFRAQAENPSAANPDMADLVPDFIAEDSTLHTVVDGVVAPVPGGECA